jgi:hypothetical protein
MQQAGPHAVAPAFTDRISLATGNRNDAPGRLMRARIIKHCAAPTARLHRRGDRVSNSHLALSAHGGCQRQVRSLRRRSDCVSFLRDFCRSFQELASRCVLHLGIMCTPKVQGAKHIWPTAAIGEFPLWNVGPPHGVASSVIMVDECPEPRSPAWHASPLPSLLSWVAKSLHHNSFCICSSEGISSSLYQERSHVRANGTAASIRFAACAHGRYWHIR